MIINKSVLNFLKSTLIVLLTSTLFSFGLTIFNLNFWGSFLFFTAFQYVLFSFFGTIIQNYIYADVRKKELDKLESLSTILNCAYCQKPNLMIFNPNDSERVEFECDHCKNKNLVTMQFVVAQITTPLEIPTVSAVPKNLENFVDELS